MAEKLGLYVHIPFCRSKCDYCDFYSLAGKEGRMDDYQKALLAHMKETAPLTRGWQVDTVYFGGTPSFYGEKRLREVLKTVAKRFDLAKDAEITVECNPDSVDKKVFQALRRAGVNRISLGVQSAHDCELNCLHRPHTFQQAQRAVAAAREAKIKNISLDLIYGLPNQDMAGWRDTVEQVLELEPEHLSCYGLKVEPGTPLDDRVVRGEKLPDDDQQADMYLWTVERLAAAGYGPEILTIQHRNFANIDQVAPGVLFDFVLADLGVSSMQIDDPARGFTFKQDGPLDLRLAPSSGVTAAERLRQLDQEELENLLVENSDEPYADRIAKAVIQVFRRGGTVDTTRQLYALIEGALSFLPAGERKEAVKKSCQRTFQALRIDVNSEFEVLYAFLDKLPHVLKPGGRAAILTFHSGEDRLVKQAFRQQYREGLYSDIAQEVTRPSPQECRRNPRAHSTKLRWAIRAE